MITSCSTCILMDMIRFFFLLQLSSDTVKTRGLKIYTIYKPRQKLSNTYCFASFVCLTIKFDTDMFPCIWLIYCQSTIKKSDRDFISKYLKNRIFKTTYNFFIASFVQYNLRCFTSCFVNL